MDGTPDATAPTLQAQSKGANMRKQQAGFTLVEIAIVLVIIGLLLGGVLKGQELINSAKVKNFAQDFRTVPVFIYGYQDRFRVLPGDDVTATTHLCPTADPTCTANGSGNGSLSGAWNVDCDAAANAAVETCLFWDHVRRANFAAGSTAPGTAGFSPKNADGGRITITQTPPVTALSGTYFVCSRQILGKYATQLDATIDNNDPTTGSMIAATESAATPPVLTAVTAPLTDSTPYVVCMGF
jgi:prepilin-type N-terminal cleavage/methylation domain-containing protein